MGKTAARAVARKKRVRRIRKKISGTPSRPRLRVFRSNRHIYAQIIDDTIHATLVSMSTMDKEFQPAEGGGKTAQARAVGLQLARKAKEAGINEVVFDRGGYIYHGRVKALSEGAREGGLQF